MELATTRFGTIQCEPDSVLTFTQPIIGFQGFRRFVVLAGPEGSPVKWLQSTESEELAFLIMDPKIAVPDYRAEVGAAVLTELAAGSIDELDVYTLIVVPQDPSQVRTNLRAPILVNPKQRLARQIVLDRSEYPIQFFLTQTLSPGESQEVVHARTDS
ncbi:MAG: flagellar assembly protein FliW [Nitrospiraceae bacterium]|nr:flagellar assembly protein FliW [Nitrospiraceae bacterium]